VMTRAMAAEELIDALCMVGDAAAALAVAEEALILAADGPPSADVIARLGLAAARLAAGDALGALDAAEAAEVVARRSSSYQDIVFSLQTLGRVHLRRGDLPAAAGAAGEALKLSGARSQSSVHVRFDLAVIEREAGKPDDSWARLVEVFRQSVELGRVLHAARAGLHLADAAAAAGDFRLASVLLVVCDRTRRAAGIEREAPGEAGATARRTFEERGEEPADDLGLSLEMLVGVLERSARP
jgi:hypothetical protein